MLVKKQNFQTTHAGWEYFAYNFDIFTSLSVQIWVLNNLQQEGMEHEYSHNGMATLKIFHEDHKAGIIYEVCGF
jgi:hypothetical protein